MQQMDKFTFRSIDTGFKVAQASYIFRLSEVADPSLSQHPYRRLSIRIRTGISHHLYLHKSSDHILKQYTSYNFSQIGRAVIDGDHYRASRNAKSTISSWDRRWFFGDSI